MKVLLAIAVIVAVTAAPAAVWAYDYGSQAGQANAAISQPIVREGTLAVSLAEALQLGTTDDEGEAESLLIAVGIAPRNGWMADFPVTPEVAAELRTSVYDAGGTSALSMQPDDAVAAYDAVLSDHGLSLREAESADGSGPESYGDETALEDYYEESGPPVVTYYAPPPDYSYLYTWVPYPFWWWDTWFPGYYVLLDFDRIIVVHGHRHFVSNHFGHRGGRHDHDWGTHARHIPYHGRSAGVATHRDGASPRAWRGGVTSGVGTSSGPAIRRGGTSRSGEPVGRWSGSAWQRSSVRPSDGGSGRILRPMNGGYHPSAVSRPSFSGHIGGPRSNVTMPSTSFGGGTFGNARSFHSNEGWRGPTSGLSSYGGRAGGTSGFGGGWRGR